MLWLSIFPLLTSCFAAQDFRAFTDDQGHYLAIKRNAVFWGDAKLMQPLSTRRFTATPQSLVFTFHDSRIQDDDSGNSNSGFEFSAQRSALYCGPGTKTFSELSASEAAKLSKQAKFETSRAQAKPVLLGLLSGTPTKPGRYRVTFEATDALKVTSTKTFLIIVLP